MDRHFVITRTKEGLTIKVSHDFGCALMLYLIEGLRTAVVEEPIEGDLSLLSLANRLETGLELRKGMGTLTLPLTWELIELCHQLRLHGQPELWTRLPADQDFSGAFLALARELDQYASEVACHHE